VRLGRGKSGHSPMTMKGNQGHKKKKKGTEDLLHTQIEREKENASWVSSLLGKEGSVLSSPAQRLPCRRMRKRGEKETVPLMWRGKM